MEAFFLLSSFFFFSSPLFFFLHSCSNSSQAQGLWQAQYAQREDEFVSQGGANSLNMNEDWEEKKGARKVKSAGVWRWSCEIGVGGLFR